MMLIITTNEDMLSVMLIYFVMLHFLLLQVGGWSESLEVVSGAGVPDPPKMPLLSAKSPHVAQVTWEEPVNNGATITEYRLEWQQRADAEFSQVHSA